MERSGVTTNTVNKKAKVRKIQTCTAEYSPAEDRVRLNCVDLEGAPFTFWITQRLLSNLVAASVGKIEEAISKTGEMKYSKAHSTSLNRLEQQAARQQKLIKPGVKPVRLDYNHDTWLCHSVNIVTLSKGFNLQFKPEEGLGEMCTIMLKTQDYRNFLDIILRTYNKAGWSISIFPSWLVNDRQSPENVSLLN